MRNTFHYLPKGVILLFGLFLGMSVISLTLPPLSPPDLTDDLGNTMAKLTALRAVEPIFHHDLVALQALLEDLQRFPKVETASIYDVENQLLVQAGERGGEAITPTQSFTSPIILQDSIAGSVHVTLKIHTNRIYYIWYLLGTCIVFFVAFAGKLVWDKGAFASKISQIRSKSVARTMEPKETPSQEKPESKTTADTPPILQVYAVIQIKNDAVLKQQLSNEIYSQTQQRVSKITADVLALYSGASYEMVGSRVILSFYANDEISEALFRAACSAHLIIELASIINTIPLDLAAFVSAEKSALDNTENLPVACLVLENSVAQNKLIQRRLKFLELGNDDGKHVVSGFAQPYKTLLEKQHKQLSQLI